MHLPHWSHKCPQRFWTHGCWQYAFFLSTYFPQNFGSGVAHPGGTLVVVVVVVVVVVARVGAIVGRPVTRLVPV